MTEVKDEHQQNGAEEMGEDNDVGNSEEGGANDTAAADEDYKPSDSSASSEATEEEDDPPSPGRKNTRGSAENNTRKRGRQASLEGAQDVKRVAGASAGLALDTHPFAAAAAAAGAVGDGGQNAMLQQLLRGVMGAQQPSPQLLQALQQRIQQQGAAPPMGAGAPPPEHHRPNSRASLTGSGGAAPAPPPAAATPTIDANNNTSSALAALQALLTKSSAGGAAGPSGMASGTGLMMPSAEGTSPQQPPQQAEQTEDVVKFLLNYVPPTADALQSSTPEGSKVHQHVEQVAAMAAQQRPRTVAYLTHVMAPPTDPAGNELLTNAQWDMLYTVLTVTSDNAKAGEAPCQTLLYRCPPDAKVYPHVAVACHLGLKNHLNKPQEEAQQQEAPRMQQPPQPIADLLRQFNPQAAAAGGAPGGRRLPLNIPGMVPPPPQEAPRQWAIPRDSGEIAASFAAGMGGGFPRPPGVPPLLGGAPNNTADLMAMLRERGGDLQGVPPPPPLGGGAPPAGLNMEMLARLLETNRGRGPPAPPVAPPPPVLPAGAGNPSAAAQLLALLASQQQGMPPPHGR